MHQNNWYKPMSRFQRPLTANQKASTIERVQESQGQGGAAASAAAADAAAAAAAANPQG